MNRRSILRFFGLAALIAPSKAVAAPVIVGADVTSRGITLSTGETIPLSDNFTKPEVI
ncbi:hypothetical protein [Methylobacterium fujisawaense]|uniref:hypothetical protein n=1 Tax=Methylobacterium fujisawaense TaxID=107400 RepID=UPI002F35CF3A